MIVLFKKNKTLVFALAEGRAANVSRLSDFALAIWNPEMI